MNVRGSVLVSVLLSAALASCGGSSKHLEYPRTPERSFIFGFINMNEAPSGLDWVTLRQVAPPVEEAFWYARVDEGAFYIETLPPGSYVLESFGSGGGFFTTPISYEMKRQANPVRFRIEKPGVYFVGSFAYGAVETGFFEPDAFDLYGVSRPTEKELLASILPFASGTTWEPVLQEHLRALP